MRLTFAVTLLLAITVSIVQLPRAFGAELAIPVTLDYGIIQQALVQQVYTWPQQTARVLSDGSGCNSLVLSDPQLSGDNDGRLHLRSLVHAKGGTPIGEKCKLSFTWEGMVTVTEEAYVTPNGTGVSFRIVDSQLRDTEGQKPLVTGTLWGWIKRYVHPRLETVTVDLGPALTGLQEMINNAYPALAPVGEPHPLLAIRDVTTNNQGLTTVFVLNVPEAPADWSPPAQIPLTPEELAQWDSAWQTWDGFATWMIKTMAVGADPELRAGLAETLLEARYDLRQALATEYKHHDPVRELFLKTWTRLAPLLRDHSLNIPGAEALKLAAFISAADALQALDTAAPHLGMRIDSNTLRSLARLLIPTASDAQLNYNTTVDPELRQLLGLDPVFDGEETDNRPFAWLIPSAQAGSVDPALVKKLTGWVPRANELNDYINTMSNLLSQIASNEREKGKIPSAYLDVYENLVLATAWQETCWRQYIRKDNNIEPIKSAAGSVGLMQVNQHVWRGVYDPRALNHNVGYNARAGNEILVHYLVDFALKKKEQNVSGNKHDLARSAYAMYNGGPKHLSRYRDPNARKSLKAIDQAFWKKYQAIRQQGAEAVKACYGP